MALFGVTTSSHEAALEFVKKTNERLNNHNLVKNPFIGKIKTVNYQDRVLHIVSMRPVYFNFTPYCWALAICMFVIKGFTWSWLCLPGIILGCVGIFWSKYFYRWLFIKGLKKAGYPGDIKNISTSEIIEGVIFKEG